MERSILQKMKKAKDNEIHYSPSLEIQNMENKSGIIVSAMDEKEWYIFFKRPMQIKSLFGLVKKRISRIHNRYNRPDN